MRNSSTQIPIGFQLNRNHSLCQGLVGCWPLNEGGGLKAFDKVYPNVGTGTLTNGAIFRQDLKGNCVTYDGVNDYVANMGLVSSYSFIQNTLVFTISLWAKLTDLVTGQVFLGNTITGSEKGFFMQYVTAGGSFGSHAIRLLVANAGGAALVIQAHSPDNSLNDLNWHHLVVTGVNGNSINFYIDGVQVATSYTTVFGSLSTGDSTNKLQFGTANTAVQVPYSGRENNIMIYNRTLSHSEVRQLYTYPYQMYIGKK